MRSSALKPAGEVRVGPLRIRRFVGGRVRADGTKETRLVYETYAADGRVSRIAESSWVGLVSREEVHSLLATAGFELLREWSGYDFASYREGDSLLIVEAAKQEDGWKEEE